MEVCSEGAGRVAAKAMRTREVGPKQRANSKSELMTQIYIITPTTHRASFYKGLEVHICAYIYLMSVIILQRFQDSYILSYN